MRFRYALLYVPDVAASLAFYEKAFGLQRRFLADGATYGELDTGEVALGFVTASQARDNLPKGYRANDRREPPGGFEVAFVADDVEAAYRKAVQAGAEPYAPPAKKPWGQVIAYVRDLDGVLVEIAGKMSH